MAAIKVVLVLALALLAQAQKQLFFLSGAPIL